MDSVPSWSVTGRLRRSLHGHFHRVRLDQNCETEDLQSHWCWEGFDFLIETNQRSHCIISQ